MLRLGVTTRERRASSLRVLVRSVRVRLLHGADTRIGVHTPTFSSQDHRQPSIGDVPIQRQIRHQPFKFAVLLPQLSHFALPAQTQHRLLLPQNVDSRVADSELATYIAHLRVRFSLSQRVQDLLLAVSLLRRLRSSSSHSEDHSRLTQNPKGGPVMS